VCTASWLKQAGSLHLFFNRDELRSREPAEGPVERVTDGVPWIAPIDGRAGGTWIAATGRGLALALLNRSEGVRPEQAESRGGLIPRLAAAARPADLASALADFSLDRLAPFRLLALWRDHRRGLVASWDGNDLRTDDVAARLGLLCSSGLGDERATASRGAVFRRRRAGARGWSPEEHRRFHRDHRPLRSAWSPCMHRPDAASVSYTEIELAPALATLRYHAAPPCLPGLDSTLSLAQRPAAAGA